MAEGHARGRRVFWLAMVLAGALFAVRPDALAIDPKLDISQYAHTSWKVSDGFVKGEILSVAQAPDGYLWLGTEFGLYRFDGVRAVMWQPPGDQQLPASHVYSLLVSRNGTFWIGTTKGLASWKGRKLTRYAELEGEYIYALLEDREGTIWVAAGGTPTSGRLCSIRSDSVECFGGDGQLGPAVVALHEDAQGNLWAGVKDGLWKWKPGPPTFYSLPGAPNGILGLADVSDGGLLIGWRGGIFRFANGKAEPYPLPGISSHFLAEKMFRDQNGSLWIGTAELGLIHLHQGRTDVFSVPDGLSSDRVYAIFGDREANVWVSTLEGLDRFRDPAVATLTTKQGLSARLVGAILPDKDGSVWLATRGGLNRWDHGRITIPSTGSLKRDGNLNGSSPDSLFQDNLGRLWVSTNRELGYLENGRFTSIKAVPEGWKLSIVQDNAGNVWVIDEQVGLLRITPQNDVLQIPWSSLGHKDNASVLAADRKQGGLWIGFFRGGISYFSDGRILASYTTVNGLGAGRISDFRFDDDGTLWVSSEGGLSRLKNRKVATLNSKNGLPCDVVHWAAEDSEHSFWLYMACGLVRIPRSELDAWVAAVDKDTTQTVQATVFDSSDGVRNLSSPTHFHPQVGKTPDGKLWFLPWVGVSVIDPHHLPFNKVPPPVHIEKITADGKTYDTSQGLHLPPRVRDLTIDYTALSFVAPEKIHFRFKLEGQDPGWREVVNDREVQYSNLPPKHFRFRVLACNNSGVWNEEGASLDFVIPPMWYQTNWFRALCAIAFLGLLWMLYQLRVRQLHQKFALVVDARVNERTRIARELHDTMLQSFQGVLMKLHALTYMLPDLPEAQQTLKKVINDARQAIAEGRDAVQGLRSSTLVTNDVAEALNLLGKELAAQSDGNRPEFSVDILGTPRDLVPLLRDEVCRITSEALRNAFRHAHARCIEVEIRYDQRQLRLRVRDDGKGIDREVLEAGGRVGHYGFSSMRERAKLIGGKLAVWSELDSGTETELTIPASTAYAKSEARRRSFFRARGA